MNEKQEAYKQGFIDGITCYAHWNDGVQEVGTCGRTLKEAIKKIEESWNYKKNYN